MPSATPSLRRQREDDSDNDLDSPGVATGSTPGSSNKRARLSLNGNASPSSQLTPSSNSHASTGLQQESLRSQPGRRKHQPGSIVRVRLENFVTYTAVEFSPGPSLNMVIGPNGTGKSTLVCAICLGLGWGAQHLGRAKDVAEFVKNGCQEALTEIELAADGKKFKRNPMVQCRITRDGNKSTFSINGKPASKKQVQELARHFSIQIDNLCQFLPQDKVVEFAAMTPVELLRSTQRAVAPQEMIDMHENLKGLRKKQKLVEDENTSNQETLASLENRQRTQEADVERMRERNEVQQRIEFLEKSRPIWQYRDAKATHKEAKDRKNDATQELEKLEAEVEPSLRAVNSKQAYLTQIEVAAKDRNQKVKQAERAADSIDQKLQDLHERSNSLGTEFKSEVDGGRKKKQEVVRIEGILARLKKQMEESPPDLDISSYNEQIRERHRDIDDLRQRSKDVKVQQTEITQKGKETNRRIDQARRDLEDLESQAGKQNSKLANHSREAYRAWQWIQENQHQFEKQVFGPPTVECSITDPKWVNQIESLFQVSNFTTFTVQTKDDLRTLSNKLNGEMKLSEINIKHMLGNLEDFQPLVSREDLPRYGLESYAIDHFTGPDKVLAMLCYDLKLHQAAIGDRDSTNQHYDMLVNSPIDLWITSKSSHKVIRRREYGPSATSTQVRDVRPGAIWTDQPVDVGAKRELQENIEEWGQDVRQYEQKIKDLQIQLVRMREQCQDKEGEIKTMAEEKAVRQKALGEFKALPTKLAQQEDKLASLHESLTGIKSRVETIHQKIDSLTLERGEVALDYADAVTALRKAHHDLYTAEVMQIEASSELQTLTERNGSVKVLLETRRKEVGELNQTASKALREAKRKLAEAVALAEDEDPAYSAFRSTLKPEMPGHEMEDEISSEKARLELMHEGNGGVIREYEQRQQVIDKRKSKAEECRVALDELGGKIQEIRDQWEPELDQLIEKISRSFSYNMQQINCAGEVGIYKDEQDFEDWAVQIRVKFREHEPLSILDSHRQSGGERAVSTIFYLMSLQSLTRSPFRVVDEINQGMDPRNERLVHKRMVHIACGSGNADGDEFAAQGIGEEGEEGGNGGGSQYFLITPKLLHGLEYARGMRVLCIASGDYMPQEKSKIDFGKCVDIARGLKGLGSLRGVAAAG